MPQNNQGNVRQPMSIGFNAKLIQNTIAEEAEQRKQAQTRVEQLETRLAGSINVPERREVLEKRLAGAQQQLVAAGGPAAPNPDKRPRQLV